MSLSSGAMAEGVVVGRCASRAEWMQNGVGGGRRGDWGDTQEAASPFAGVLEEGGRAGGGRRRRGRDIYERHL